MRRYLLNPGRIVRGIRNARRIARGGGPRHVKLVSVSAPDGVLIPTACVVLEVTAADGHTERFEPDLPVPWPYAWAYRIARRLGVPLVVDLPEERELGWQLGKKPRKRSRAKKK